MPIRTQARRPALLAFVFIAVAVLLGAPASVPARAASPATVSLTGEYVRIGGTATVTVVDAGASTAQVNPAESAGSTTYSIPVASTGDTFVFQTRNPLVMDKNGDGVTSAADVTLSIASAVTVSLVPASGVFTIQLVTDVTSPTPFTINYWSERVDTLTAKVTSSSDTTGFTLTLQETLADSGIFTGTFDTGASTVTTNASSPTAGARPDIKVVDKDIVTVTYTDTDPLALLSDTILVDGVVPSITQLSPTHNVYEQTFSSFFEARITDLDSGVDVSSIKFHLDEDGDATFDEPGQILLPDPLMTTEEPNGVIVRVRVPSTAPDGLRSWYVTALDNAGGLGRSDSNATATGNQNHVFTSDQNPPQIVSAVAGEWYDPASKSIKTGNRNTVHVTFSEKILVSSINAAGFRFNGVPALSAETVTTLPNDVFVTVESYPTEGPVILLIDPGSVTDMAGIATSLVPVTVTDKVPPVLTINFDRTATNALVNINVTSDEALAATPSITINGLTRGVPTQLGAREWQLVFNVATLTGTDTGQGAKTVGAFGFDESNTLGVAASAAFELDSTVTSPTITPSGSDPVSEAFPDITVSYAAEAGEYPGDSHTGVSLLFASLDGEPVTPLMTTSDGGATWVLKAMSVRPEGYENGTHVFAISAVDAAGNQHDLAQTVFLVDVPPPPPPEPAVEVKPEDPVEESESVVADDSSVENEAPAVEEPENTDVPTPELGSETEGSTSDALHQGITDGASDEYAGPAAEAQDVVEPAESTVDAVNTVSGSDEPAGDEIPVEAVVAVAEPETVPEEPAEEPALESSLPSTGESIADEPNVDPVFDREAELAALDGDGTSTETSTAESGGALFGCNLPLGNTNVVGGEYALLGVGLLGLGLRGPAGALRARFVSRGRETRDRVVG